MSERDTLIGSIISLRPEYSRTKLERYAELRGNRGLEGVLETIQLENQNRAAFATDAVLRYRMGGTCSPIMESNRHGQ